MLPYENIVKQAMLDWSEVNTRDWSQDQSALVTRLVDYLATLTSAEVIAWTRAMVKLKRSADDKDSFFRANIVMGKNPRFVEVMQRVHDAKLDGSLGPVPMEQIKTQAVETVNTLKGT